MARATVSPPTPESKTPIGAEALGVMGARVPQGVRAWVCSVVLWLSLTVVLPALLLLPSNTGFEGQIGFWGFVWLYRFRRRNPFYGLGALKRIPLGCAVLYYGYYGVFSPFFYLRALCSPVALHNGAAPAEVTGLGGVQPVHQRTHERFLHPTNEVVHHRQVFVFGFYL